MGEGARDNERKGRDETGEEEEAMRREVSCGGRKTNTGKRLGEKRIENRRRSAATGSGENEERREDRRG